MSTFAVSNCCCCLFAAKNLHRNLGILGFRHFETFKVESSLLNNKIQCPQSNVSPKELANRMGCPSFVYVNNIRNRRQILYTTTSHSGSLGVLLVCWRRLRSATLLLTLAAYFACGMQIDLYATTAVSATARPCGITVVGCMEYCCSEQRWRRHGTQPNAVGQHTTTHIVDKSGSQTQVDHHRQTNRGIHEIDRPPTILFACQLSRLVFCGHVTKLAKIALLVTTFDSSIPNHVNVYHALDLNNVRPCENHTHTLVIQRCLLKTVLQ